MVLGDEDMGVSHFHRLSFLFVPIPTDFGCPHVEKTYMMKMVLISECCCVMHVL